MNYAMFFAGMLAMALFGGLIVFFIIRPWTRPMRRGWESNHEVITENYRLSAAQVKRQTAEEQERANQASITAEQTRARLIEAQGGNDRAEIQRKATFKQDGIMAAIAIEGTRTRLIEARAENDQLEIERRAALRRAGINPDAPKPKNWFVKHRYLVVLIIAIGLLVAMMAIKPYLVNQPAPNAQSVNKNIK